MRHELKMAVLLAAGVMTTGCAHGGGSGGSNLAAQPDTFEARRKLAGELMARADWQPAFAYVDQLHRERPGDAGVLVLRGTIYREQSLLDEAEADLRDAARLAPELASARAALGILFDLQRKPEKAEEQLRLAVKLQPDNAGYLNNLGFSLFLHGKTKEAISFYEKAARLAPATRRTRTNLGFACAAQGDWHRAAREFALGGTPVEAKVNLGFAYEQHGDLSNAYDLYVEATRMDPQSKRARSNLVHVAELLGRPAPAMPGEAPATSPVRDDGAPVAPSEAQP